MGWLKAVHNGLPFVTAPYPLLDPLCLAALNTCLPFVGPLPATLTVTLTSCGRKQNAWDIVVAAQNGDGKHRASTLCAVQSGGHATVSGAT
eukprot:361190-Chlamydomonas_euryale.AAC.3